MPQMSPLNWLMLMLFFSTIFIIIYMMNFYSFNINMPKLNKSSILNKKNFTNWKW
nr:ATP synthase F0 subunit 8 [Manota sp. WQY001]